MSGEKERREERREEREEQKIESVNVGRKNHCRWKKEGARL